MSFSEAERENPGDPLKRWVEIMGEGVGLEMGVAINNPGRGLNEIADPVLGTVIADGVTITYQAGRIQTEFLWRAQFSVSGDYYIVEFLSPGGVDRTELVRNILSTFRFTDPTAGWKTFSDDNGGFSFRYPAEFPVPRQTGVSSYGIGPYSTGGVYEGSDEPPYSLKVSGDISFLSYESDKADYDDFLRYLNSAPEDPYYPAFDIQEEVLNGNRAVYFNTGGICDFGYGYLFISGLAVQVQARCSLVDDTLRGILESFRLALP